MKLRYPAAVWHHKGGLTTGTGALWYAFPLGARDKGDLGVQPVVNDPGWEPKGTVPDGTPVSEVHPKEGDLVECKLGNVTATTARWALEE